MARNVRNVWVDAKVDGAARGVSFGPRAKDGGLEITVYVRHRGEIVRAVEVWAVARDDGRITLHVDMAREAKALGVSVELADGMPGMVVVSRR